LIRYAVYFAPDPESELYRFGSAWLGRDARTDELLVAPQPKGLTPEHIAAITAEPRQYGFHATLKPPFSLAAGRTAVELGRGFESFAREAAAFAMPALALAEIGGFLALVPSAPCAELDLLAERAVRAFDAFRAPPTPTELASRAQGKLDVRERELLAAWGYPYVLDRWRFHMTLTGRLEPNERERVRTALAPLTAPFCRDPLRVDAVALFVQSGPDVPFRYQSRFTFGRPA
jgi:putative phosphonate metabolism protein